MDVPESKRLKALEDENDKLKGLLADARCIDAEGLIDHIVGVCSYTRSNFRGGMRTFSPRNSERA